VFNVCVLYFIGHKPDISIAGGAGLLTTCHRQETNRLKRKDTHPQYIDDRGVIDVKFAGAYAGNITTILLCSHF
jgi:hypothetical protein